MRSDNFLGVEFHDFTALFNKIQGIKAIIQLIFSFISRPTINRIGMYGIMTCPKDLSLTSRGQLFKSPLAKHGSACLVYVDLIIKSHIIVYLKKCEKLFAVPKAHW